MDQYEDASFDSLYKQLMRARSKSKKETQKQPSPPKEPSSPNQRDSLPSKTYTSRLKKMMAPDITSKNQKKITCYFPAHSLSSNTEEETPVNPEDQKIEELRNQLLQKQQQVNKFRAQKEIVEHKFSKLYLESKNFKHKSKQIILKVMREQAARRREEKARVDYRIGHFTGDLKNFVDGEEIIKINESITETEEKITQLEADYRKSKSEEQKNRTKFSIVFMKKQLKRLKGILQGKERQQQVYKEKLKLAHKEQYCEYSLANWPLLKDSSGHERYQTLELLGKGGFGEVYKCFDLQDNQMVAIKLSNICLDYGQETAENTLKHIMREVNTLKTLQHQNIVQMKDVLEINSKRIVFVLEYCSGPELSVYLKKHSALEEKDAKQIIYQLFAALHYLFGLEKKVIHYDLKPSNIIFHNGTVKILDFGLCKLMEGEESRMDLTSQGAGTYWYLPPQTFCEEGTKISSTVDVWSVGVIFYELLYGKRPFANGISQKMIMQKNLIQKEAQNLAFPQVSPKGYKISKQAKKFISECLEYFPEQRLSPAEAFHHPYFGQYSER